MAVTEQTETMSVGEDVGKLEPGAPLVGMPHEAATVGSSVEVPQEITNAATIGPSNSTSGAYPRELQPSFLSPSPGVLGQQSPSFPPVPLRLDQSHRWGLGKHLLMGLTGLETQGHLHF